MWPNIYHMINLWTYNYVLVPRLPSNHNAQTAFYPVLASATSPAQRETHLICLIEMLLYMSTFPSIDHVSKVAKVAIRCQHDPDHMTSASASVCAHSHTDNIYHSLLPLSKTGLWIESTTTRRLKRLWCISYTLPHISSTPTKSQFWRRNRLMVRRHRITHTKNHKRMHARAFVASLNTSCNIKNIDETSPSQSLFHTTS